MFLIWQVSIILELKNYKTTHFKFKGFEIDLDRDEDSPYLFVWEAENKKTGVILGDREGGELNTIANAKKTIKKWIVAYLTKKTDYYPKDIVLKSKLI